MSNVYRVVFKADQSDNTEGKIPQKLGMHGGDQVWTAYVKAVPSYSTLESVHNILAMAYTGLTGIDPMYAEDPEGKIILLKT